MSTTRPRTGGNDDVSAARPLQNFKPKSEWKHEEAASFLLIYLPGFVLDQLIITPDYSTRTVKVEGKRRLPNNRIMPLDETFDVPQHLDLSKLDKQPGRGILMLKIPTYLNVSKPQQQQSVEEDTPKLDRETIQDPMIDPPKAKQTTDNKASIDEKNEQDSDDRRQAVKPEGSDEAATEEKGSTTNHPILTILAETNEEKMVSNRTREGPETENVTKNNGEGVVNDGNKEESKGSAMDTSTKKVAKVEEKVKEMGKEDKTLIMNMGIAVVIIMGLGVSLLYSLGH